MSLSATRQRFKRYNQRTTQVLRGSRCKRQRVRRRVTRAITPCLRQTPTTFIKGANPNKSKRKIKGINKSNNQQKQSNTKQQINRNNNNNQQQITTVNVGTTGSPTIGTK